MKAAPEDNPRMYGLEYWRTHVGWMPWEPGDRAFDTIAEAKAQKTRETKPHGSRIRVVDVSGAFPC